MFDALAAVASPEAVDAFISRWKDSTGTEKANYQLFLSELCALLELPTPDPASKDNSENAYTFERRVDIANPDGSENRGFIDLYKRGAFVLEAKQTGKGLETKGWDKAMQAAYNQADQYVRALPANEGRPPFIVVTDVGRTLALYSEFSRSGGTYVPFPDPRNYRIKLEDLRHPEIQQRLKALWEAPDTLDPSQYAARVTRAVSSKLAALAKTLEADGYEVDRVAHFLKRCLFTMFSEDVELLPKNSFTDFLTRMKETPEHFADAIGSLWESMNSGGFSGVLTAKLMRFNGGLFKDIDPIPLNAEQIQLLIDAAKADWRFVEPAIFGTLLERALDPRERHKLGAHYTPRAYVERLVMPTLIEPLRREWATAQVVAEAHNQKGKTDKALESLRTFHHKLCQVRVLDPACGSANFLYVALEHMKRLEGEVLNLIAELSGGQDSLEAEGFTVSPQQFLGMEINPRAAAIAEIVLWIGYLQWHYRINGKLDLPEPILKDFHNIENRDALIEFERREPLLDESGQAVTIWDGISMKKSPATGELIPDETARTTVYRYHNPKRAEWPEADYIVGNPPFIGASTMRRALGDGYVDAVRQVFKGTVPESADFVMYWWHIAADAVRNGHAQQFGFITTNSLRQTFNRRVLEPHLNDAKKPLSLTFAIPDHPWVDGNDGAAVRIAMTVGRAGEAPGLLQQVIKEDSDESREARSVALSRREGKVFADLTIGADVAGVQPLLANSTIASRGVQLIGSGFIVTPEEANQLGFENDPALEQVIRNYRNGRDLTQTPRGVKVIDLFGLTAEEAKAHYPSVYQWVFERVKPERDQNKRAGYRDNWWIFGEARRDWRRYADGLPRYIATVETAKHRLFTFLDADILPDNKLINIALQKGEEFGLLSSRLHILWSLAAGSRLGVGNDSVYVKTRCFETFPFPELTDEQAAQIGQLAEQIDAHRKRQQAEHSTLTLTGMYNVMEKLRAGETLTKKEQTINQQGLVSTLLDDHDNLDRAVFNAYGWDDLADKLVGLPGATTPLPDKPAAQAETEEELLMRLVALNKQRAAEEAQGKVRWLRPDYQAPEEAAPTQTELQNPTAAAEVPTADKTKAAWPKDLATQVTLLRDMLAASPHSTESLASQFKRKPLKGVNEVLSALAALGQAQQEGEQWRLVR
ncbi:class I SAM-dependent DNA methyltransferase [Vreelandella salicampi]|uniref:site-specific DNA-methyltransferase (adenine-specific) n=1 Tax=Vreelandella salicampi TaxID=1449798 RepID=A0A7Z0LME4_9GAMM|nr:DNA methyltransferase [Halomonas salicampi]NYS61638.1 class I SAM-dependent DNA methyltransferase [Halomonas salicampi]